MPAISGIQSLGEYFLEQTTQPAPRLRLLRDVLRVSPTDPRLLEAKAALQASRWVQELVDTQWADGTWGRFHSQDTSIKQKFPTTEAAVSRALALGLDKDSPILQKAMGYMLKHLQDEVEWRDPREKHDAWPVNIKFVTAGVLAKIDPIHPALQPYCQAWVEIARRTFQAGFYDPQAEWQAHLELYGMRMKGKYFRLSPLYPLLLLASANPGLPENLEVAWLNWVWDKPDGIYYVNSSRISQIPELRARHFVNWLNAMELLSRFSYWGTLAREAIPWLWEQQDPEGGWDLSQHARTRVYFPLSESWRDPLDRRIDCSARILALIRRFADLQ